MTDPYKVLNVSPTASDDEVREAYRKLSLKYHPDMHAQSPLADLAEKKMKEINAAFDAIMDLRRGGSAKSNTYNENTEDNYGSGNPSYSEIRRHIQNGDITVADNMLDHSSLIKNAEWYFLKGTVCHKRGWLNDAFSNFTMAVKLDPANAEYNAALNQMLSSRQGNMNGNPNPYRQNSIGGCSGCDMCSGLLCADCCCECMGGDLIRCC